MSTINQTTNIPNPTSMMGESSILRRNRRLINRCLSRERRRKFSTPLIALGFVSYFMTVPLISGIGLSKVRLPQFAVYFALIVVVIIPLVVALYINARHEKELRLFEDITEQYCKANGGGVVSLKILSFVEDQLKANKTPEKIIDIYAKRGIVIDELQFHAMQMAIEAKNHLLPPSASQESQQATFTKVCWYIAENHVIVGVQFLYSGVAGAVRPISDWMMVASLTKSYPDIYVDIEANGKNSLLDASDAVSVVQLEGLPFRIFTATGGETDVYQLFDAFGVEKLQAIKPRFDFELFNNRLVLRQSRALPRLFRKKQHYQLFYPDVMETIDGEFNTLLGFIEHASHSVPSRVSTISDTWHDKINQARWHNLLAIGRRDTLDFIMLSTLVMIAMLMPFLLAVVIFGS